MEKLIYGSGFECTSILETYAKYGEQLDVLDGTRHRDEYKENGVIKYKWDEDFELATKKLKTNWGRYTAWWHGIMPEPNVYRWDKSDKIIDSIEKHGFNPWFDLVHHVTPWWTSYDHEDFPKHLQDFAFHFADRYPRIKRYTIINEPLVTMIFCGDIAIWHPFKQRRKVFAQMLLNCGVSICNISKMLREMVPGVSFLHPDTCEYHVAVDPNDQKSVRFANFANQRRFWVDDMMRGEITEEHNFYKFCKNLKIDVSIFQFFRDNPFLDYTRGLDYYPHSEHEHKGGSSRPSKNVRGFEELAMDYIERYPNIRIMLSETNTRATVYGRCTWLKYMVQSCEKLQRKLAYRLGFIYYGLADACCWCDLCVSYNLALDPVGLYYLSDDPIHGKMWTRNPSVLTEVFEGLVTDKITGVNIPAFLLEEPVDEALAPFEKFMEDWDWIDPVDYEKSQVKLMLAA